MSPTTDARERIDARLLHRYHHHGDRAAYERLVQRSQPILRKFIRPYLHRGHPQEDLEQVANLGLVKAVEGFDPGRGGRFVSYLAPTVQGEIKRHFRDTSRAVHVPRSVQENLARALALADDRPTSDPRVLAELARRAGLTGEDVENVVRANETFTPLSLDLGSGGADDDEPGIADAWGAPDPGYDRVEDRATIEAACEAVGLDPGDREIVALRYDEDLYQREIAERVGCSQMQVSRRLTECDRRLRRLGAAWSRPRGRRPA